jgi:hypothetical protein
MHTLAPVLNSLETTPILSGRRSMFGDSCLFLLAFILRGAGENAGWTTRITKVCTGSSDRLMFKRDGNTEGCSNLVLSMASRDEDEMGEVGAHDRAVMLRTYCPAHYPATAAGSDDCGMSSSDRPIHCDALPVRAAII